MGYRSDKNAAANALGGAAVLFLLPGLLFWPIHGLLFDLADWVLIGGSAFFIVMAIWARFMPLAPVVISTAMYLCFVGWQVMQGTVRGPVMWILYGATTLLLVVAVVNGVRRRTPPPMETMSPS